MLPTISSALKKVIVSDSHVSTNDAPERKRSRPMLKTDKNDFSNSSSEGNASEDVPIKKRRLDEVVIHQEDDTAENHESQSLLKRLADYIVWMLDFPGNNSILSRFARAVIRPFTRTSAGEEEIYSDDEDSDRHSRMSKPVSKFIGIDWKFGDINEDHTSTLIRRPLNPDHWTSLNHASFSHSKPLPSSSYSMKGDGDTRSFQDSFKKKLDSSSKYSSCNQTSFLPQSSLKYHSANTSQEIQSHANSSFKFPSEYPFKPSRNAVFNDASHSSKSSSVASSGMNGQAETSGYLTTNSHVNSDSYSFRRRHFNKMSLPHNNLQHGFRKRIVKKTAYEVIQIEEKEQYKLLLQRYTSEMLTPRTRILPTPEQEDVAIEIKSDPVSPVPQQKSGFDIPAFYQERLDKQQSSHLERRIRSLPFGSAQNSFFDSKIRKSTSQLPPPKSVVSNGIFSSKHRKDTRTKTINESNAAPSTSKQALHNRSTPAPFPNQGKDSIFFSESWLQELKRTLRVQSESAKKAIKQEEVKLQTYQQKREAEQAALQAKIKDRMKLKEFDTSDLSLLESSQEDEIKSRDFPELTSEMEEIIEDALRPIPPDEILAKGFNLSIRRRDIETLAGLNWLNDEIINFYMNLLVERGKLDNYPSVYAFNTFFYPRLISGGHSALKRWTRKIDVFSYDFIVIPVHLGVHWCLAVVNFKAKKLQYYDSMGGKNMECLQALRTYLQDESLDKKKEEMDTTDWVLENVKDIPHQMNGSDCGMFACKYAEYVTRRAKINFTQADMPYFRRRMVYEILTQQLL